MTSPDARKVPMHWALFLSPVSPSEMMQMTKQRTMRGTDSVNTVGRCEQIERELDAMIRRRDTHRRQRDNARKMRLRAEEVFEKDERRRWRTPRG